MILLGCRSENKIQVYSPAWGYCISCSPGTCCTRWQWCDNHSTFFGSAKRPLLLLLSPMMNRSRQSAPATIILWMNRSRKSDPARIFSPYLPRISCRSMLLSIDMCRRCPGARVLIDVPCWRFLCSHFHFWFGTGDKLTGGDSGRASVDLGARYHCDAAFTYLPTGVTRMVPSSLSVEDVLHSYVEEVPQLDMCVKRLEMRRRYGERFWHCTNLPPRTDTGENHLACFDGRQAQASSRRTLARRLFAGENCG